MVYACHMLQLKRERLAVLDVKDIIAYVAMVPSVSLPHPDPGDGPVYFAVGKLGVDSRFVVDTEHDGTLDTSDG